MPEGGGKGGDTWVVHRGGGRRLQLRGFAFGRVEGDRTPRSQVKFDDVQAVESMGEALGVRTPSTWGPRKSLTQLEKQDRQKPRLGPRLGERWEIWVGEQEVQSVGPGHARVAPDHTQVLEEDWKFHLFLPSFSPQTGENKKENLSFAKRQELILNVVSGAALGSLAMQDYGWLKKEENYKIIRLLMPFQNCRDCIKM